MIYAHFMASFMLLEVEKTGEPTAGEAHDRGPGG